MNVALGPDFLTRTKMLMGVGGDSDIFRRLPASVLCPIVSRESVSSAVLRSALVLASTSRISSLSEGLPPGHNHA